MRMRMRGVPIPAHRVVVVGAGFGGLSVVGGLAGAPVAITLVDRRNHHIFQPLLYQVATASLADPEVAWPIRNLVRDRLDVTTLLGDVAGVDAERGRVVLADGSAIAFDTLVLASGASHDYFGHPEWAPFAPGLKTLDDAAEIRSRILLAFERAERCDDAAARAAELRFVVVGGGPTGVELAGTIADLAHDTLASDYRRIDTAQARVILVEAGGTLLAGYPAGLRRYAQRALEGLGVEVRLGQPVTACDANGVELGSGRIEARTVLWAAGTRASPAARWLDAPADRAGRLRVAPNLTVPGRSAIFAIGDTALVEWRGGKPVPGIAPAAKQQGRYVARVIRARLGDGAMPGPFRYRHAGSLAQIGKRHAVADFGLVRLRGALAWWVWGIAHIYFLIGLRARLVVAINWLWISLRNQRSARLITEPATGEAVPPGGR